MKGRIRVVGTGPGDSGNLTPAVLGAIGEADVIVGYRTYLNQIETLISGREIISNGMKQEVDRCRAAIQKAREGFSVVLVSGGDAGVYGLAGLTLELLDEEEARNVEIIPGVTSATACAALLGAPLIHDFAVISLSDLLTDADLIRKRLELAALGDFVTVIYNPKSRKRTELFHGLKDIFIPYRSEDTPVGLVQNAYRDNQRVRITELKDLNSEDWVDMGTTVIIGNSRTVRKGGRMITPRGYRI